MFDSQNNNRGGYNVGSLYYYTSSVLSLEWTNQHSCADPNNHCEQIVQYMCGDLVRDGATTQTIPDNPANCEDYDCNNDVEYGMHENYDYYLDCRLRQRNTGLFTADRNLRRQTARFTRQNENGNRRGYECPEERDYYPYWHPTPWRDIVIFTNDASRCPYYQSESQNIKSRFACVLPPNFLTREKIRSDNPIIPNTQEECEAVVSAEGNGTWTEFPPDSRLSAPECIETLWSRDNHLGNTIGGFPISYNWTIPDLTHDHCVLRIRYNISTAEYNGWDSAVNSSIGRLRDIRVLDGATVAGEDPPLNPKVISELTDVYERFGFSSDEARERGYVFRQNPVVKVFPDVNDNSNNFGLQLAINTNQFGRTFQDRSHTFAIRARPEELQDVKIHNLNVRGKRGNIVQVYPGVEYDFVPNRVEMAVNDYIHIQWTGSNTNPNNNDGQGRAGTDRSNMVILRPPNYPEGDGSAGTASGHWGNSYPANLDDNTTSFLGLSREDRQNLATLVNLQLGGEMSELDDAGTYYDLGPRKVTRPGTYYFMCSRNNNFSNRGQKGVIIVTETATSQKRIGWSGGAVELNGHTLEFPQAALSTAGQYSIEEFTDKDQLEAMTDVRAVSDAGETVSSYILVSPPTQFDSQNGGMATIAIPIDTNVASGDVTIVRANAASRWEYVELDTRVEDDMATADTSSGGVFVVNSQINSGLIAGVVVAAFVLLVIGIAFGGLVVYFVVRRDKWQKAKDNTRKFKQKVTRSFARQV
jgi:hypothetical protein